MTANRKLVRLAGELSCFMQQYARKAHTGHDPNDRRFDKKIEKVMRRLRPNELSELLTSECNEEPTPESMDGTVEIEPRRRR